MLTVASGAPDPPRQGWWDEDGFRELGGECARAARRGRRGLRRDPPSPHVPPPPRASIPSAAATPRPTARRARARVGGGESAGTVAVPAGAGCSPRRAARWRRLSLRRRCSPPQHPDHVWVRDTVLDARGPDATPLLYEELPYLWGEPADGEAQRAAARRRCTPSRSIPHRPGSKAERIAAYASQIAASRRHVAASTIPPRFSLRSATGSCGGRRPPRRARPSPA